MNNMQTAVKLWLIGVLPLVRITITKQVGIPGLFFSYIQLFIGIVKIPTH